MAAELPLNIDHRRLLADGGRLTGSISAQHLARVNGIFRPNGVTEAHLELTRSEDGRLLASGEFSAPIEAQCQRCLEWMSLNLCGQFEVDVRAVEDEDDNDGAFELDGQRLDVVTLIEDEIILACPMIPTHAARDCHNGSIPESRPLAAPRENPFASLSDLLKQPR
jgi:uncharacterized protein